VRTSDGTLHEPLTTNDLGPYIEPCLLAAEDKRYYWHPGVDPLALARAVAQAVRHGRAVSGASTLTQQVARHLFHRPPGLWGKVVEAMVAFKLALRWSKRDILLAYLNLVEFGPNIVGIQAASRHFFDADLAALSLSQVAALVAIPRGPSLYAPRT